MRNIKFRVWVKNIGKMFHPVEALVWKENETCVAIGYLYGSDDDILMQSTELKDITGKEIFEGDIVRFITFDAVDIVVYEPPSFKTRNYSLQGYECEVMGNIYENPKKLLCKQSTNVIRHKI